MSVPTFHAINNMFYPDLKVVQMKIQSLTIEKTDALYLEKTL